MDRIVRSGGYAQEGYGNSLAVPRASEEIGVYGITVGVFLFHAQPLLEHNRNQ